MKYKFQIGDLVMRKVGGDLGLVTGLVPGPIRTDRDFRYTVLIQGVTYKLNGYNLTKVSESNDV